jgi:hypothetical protein
MGGQEERSTSNSETNLEITKGGFKYNLAFCWWL